jgi:hypothetical protein
MNIEPETYYRPSAPELRPVASVNTLNQWRHKEFGPSWTYSGRRVLYQGKDVLEFLERNKVTTRAA